MTLKDLYEEAMGLPEEERQKFKGRPVRLSKAMSRAYPGLKRLARARIHTVLDRAVKILTECGEYVTVHPRSGRGRAYTLQNFNIEP